MAYSIATITFPKLAPVKHYLICNSTRCHSFGSISLALKPLLIMFSVYIEFTYDILISMDGTNSQSLKELHPRRVLKQRQLCILFPIKLD